MKIRRSKNGKTPVHTYSNGSEVFDEAGIGAAKIAMLGLTVGNISYSVSIISTMLAAKFCSSE